MKKGEDRGLNAKIVYALTSNEGIEKNTQISFLIQCTDRMYSVLVADVAFIYLDHKTVYLIDFKGDKHLVLKTLDEIEKTVSPHLFYRINRQMIINRYAIKDIEIFVNAKKVVHLTIPFSEEVTIPRPTLTPFLNWIERG